MYFFIFNALNLGKNSTSDSKSNILHLAKKVLENTNFLLKTTDIKNIKIVIKEMQTLQNIHKTIWQQLTKAQVEEGHPFRLAIVATINENTPNMRVAIIRKTNQEFAEIWFYTDYYSQKVQDIKDNNNVTWLFYDPIERTQIRFYGNAQVLHNPTANHYIRGTLPDSDNIGYLRKESSEDSQPSNPILFEPGQNNKNFCIVKTKIHTIDWLQLTQKGHLRAKFELKNDEWKAEWISS